MIDAGPYDAEPSGEQQEVERRLVEEWLPGHAEMRMLT